MGRHKILITRPQPQADETARRIAALQLVPLVAPMLEVAVLPTCLPTPDSIQAILVTSSNALLAPLDLFRAADTPLLAVGDATAARARQAGHRHVHSAAGDASALVKLATQLCNPAGSALFLASGEGQGHKVAAALAAHGFEVVHQPVYKAIEATAIPAASCDALRRGAVRAGLFFSAETARVFVHLAAGAGLRDAVTQMDALAISASTQAALALLPWREIRVAVQPNQDDLLALLQ